MLSSESTLSVCDFSRSFVRWRHDTTKKPLLTASRRPPTTLNNVRMPLECVIAVSRDGKRSEFGLSCSCKTEQVFVDRDVWMQPNADMCAICSVDQFMVIKRWDKVDKGEMLHPPSLGLQPDRHCIDPGLAFENHALAIRRRPARRIEAIEEIIEIFSGDREAVSRTSYTSPAGRVTLEYPVKTVNYSERHRYYQVDTGPVLFVGEATGPSLIERLHLAYIAHLGRNWAEFLVCRPTLLDGTSVSVHHFSEVHRVEAENSLWVVTESP